MVPLAVGLFALNNQRHIAAWSSEVTRQPIEERLARTGNRPKRDAV